MSYAMQQTEKHSGYGSRNDRDKWYFLDQNTYPKLANERILEHLYDCGSLTLEQLQKEEIKIKNAVLDIINAEITYGSIIAYQKNGITKYKLTKEGKGIAKMLKEKVDAWENQKRLRGE